MAKFISISMIICTLISLSSCNIFTNSIGTNWFGQNFSRPYEARVKNINTNELANMAGDVEYLRDASFSLAIMNELSKRSDEEISARTTTQKENVMNLLVNTVLPLNQIVMSLNALTSENPMETEDDLINNLVTVAQSVDPTAAVKILQDKTTLSDADTQAMMVACVALITQIVSAETTETSEKTPAERFNLIKDTITDLQEGTVARVATANAIDEGVINVASAEKLEAIIDVLLVLGGKSTLKDADDNTIDRSDDLKETKYGEINLASFLGLSTENSSENPEEGEEGGVGG
ncbi:MAG: hypothetical protein GX220_01380 [Treponema sp.]|nr:hypothetical protein [Treponema sp.]